MSTTTPIDDIGTDTPAPGVSDDGVVTLNVNDMLDSVYVADTLIKRLTEMYGEKVTTEAQQKKLAYIRGYTEAICAFLTYCDGDFSSTEESLKAYMRSIDALFNFNTMLQQVVSDAS